MANTLDLVINVVIFILVIVLIYRYVKRRRLAKTKQRVDRALHTPTPKKEHLTAIKPPQRDKPTWFMPSQPTAQPIIQEPPGEPIEEEIEVDENPVQEVHTRVRRLKDILNLFPGIYTIPIVWAISIGFILLLRYVIIGPSMHSIGPEYLEIGFLGLAMGVLVLEAIFIIVLLEFPGIWEHMKTSGFKKDFKQLTHFERWVVLLASLYFVAYVFLNSMQLI